MYNMHRLTLRLIITAVFAVVVAGLYWYLMPPMRSEAESRDAGVVSVTIMPGQ